MSLRIYKKHVLSLFCMTVATFPAIAQTDSLFLTIDQLFERGVRHSLQIQADVLKESIAQERTHTARSAQLPDLQIGLKGGYVGQPILFEQGLAHPTRPEAPDWSQNYAIDLTQPIYQGGKIRYSIRKADLEKEVASLQTLTDQSEIKLGLLNQYIGLFSLFKQREVLSRNIEESERRLQDIRRMKKEGLITNNDVLRSEMQLTNDRLSLQETDNSLILVSQQLDILIGLDENLLLKPDTTLLDQTVSLETYEDENKTQPRNIERYDLQTDGKVNLSIKNSFRHWVERDWINRSAPYGMEICNNDVSSSPIDKFNNHSYLLSNRGALTTGFSVIQDHAVSTKNLTMSGATNSHVDWHKDPGTYSYSANIVWDKTRKLTTPISSTFTVENISNFGVLITLFGGDTFGYHTFIRIFRTKGTSSSFEYCDVALCGCKHLYDNGNSICGFEWKTGSQEKQVGVIPNGAIQFSGDNIICRSTSYPVVGTWTDGDIIYNTGTTTPTLWIRVNGNWIAK